MGGGAAAEILPLVEALEAWSGDPRELDRLLRRHPKQGRGLYSKTDLIRGLRVLAATGGEARRWDRLVRKLRLKPVRTLSGVAPVAVLTRPHPCPGRCVFCPSDVRMPKSYLADEPGAQRAARHRFDPFRQTWHRLRALEATGHALDKVELLVLGGTWSAYPAAYRVWFVRRCFEALNTFGAAAPPPARTPVASEAVPAERSRGRYNRWMARLGPAERFPGPDGAEAVQWAALEAAQERNETAAVRCVGLSVETRPDAVTGPEVLRLRRLGCTKLQLGLQSLSDRLLRLNRRGHDVAASRSALRRLRGAGFKLHVHWMPNLYGATPASDRRDFERLFADPDFRPDELKIYPCSLLESAELMDLYRSGRWAPYRREELVDLLVDCLAATPAYCRVTRVIRDIPGPYIVAGNRTTNLREVVEREMARRGLAGRDIRCREVRERGNGAAGARIEPLRYRTSIGEEVFLQALTREGRLAGFLRLSLPACRAPLPELEGAALVREVHVYGPVVPLGATGVEGAQHGGLGARLLGRARQLAGAAGHSRLAVISAVGTRAYYRRLGFADGELYQHAALDGAGGSSEALRSAG